ncbi:MAG TPA: helicase C-terminal domain-containing protein, partial [Halanaerobiales bacterium]|nr:helicase C-terminal domain-containing protein [Halanaerobiales bacterium]
RKEVYSADLLVVNHHLLLADARLKYDLNDESGVLPPYKNLIIDEAHNINEVATKHLGKSFYFNSLQKFIDRLNENKYSLVPSIRNDISNHKINDKKKLYKVLDNKITPLIKRIDEFSKNYYNIVKGFFNEYSDDYQLRLKNKYMKTDKWEKVYRNGDKLLGYLTNLNYYFNDLYEDLMLNDNLSEDFDETIVELESILGRLSKLIDNLDFNLEAEENNYVFWLEKKRKRENSIINQMNAPLEVSDLLAEYIWDKLDSLILTSATLTVDKSFDFFANGLGLKNADTLRIESPFDYENQAVLAIPGNIPQANSKDFLDKIIEDLQEIIISYGGETLVLFTSYSMLNYCYNYMTDNFQKHNLNILAQGSYSRKYIIESFKENNSQIIFGTVSFWEGIDIKGDDLKYLIMMKLPFPVPSEAVASARKEKIKENGQNPFYDYSLPRAVIRFKQGFGRLIRSKKDKGMITVLDNRLLNKSYGKIFLNSLPETCPIKKVKMRSLIRKEKIGGSYEK